MPRSKADLEDIFGAPDSENRKIIAARSLPMLGQDFVPGWLLFLFFLYKLMGRLLPHADHLWKYILLLFIGTLLFDYLALFRMVAAAHANVFTDAMALTIQQLSRMKWICLFVSTGMCTAIFARSHRAVRIGDYLLLAASIAGTGAALSGYTWLIGPAVFGLFLGLCGISVLFLLKPELLYEA